MEATLGRCPLTICVNERVTCLCGSEGYVRCSPCTEIQHLHSIFIPQMSRIRLLTFLPKHCPYTSRLSTPQAMRTIMSVIRLIDPYWQFVQCPSEDIRSRSTAQNHPVHGTVYAEALPSIDRRWAMTTRRARGALGKKRLVEKRRIELDEI